MSNIKCDHCGGHKPNDAVSNEVTKRALPVTYSYADMKTDALEKELTNVFNRHNVDTALGMHDYVIAGMVTNFLITISNANTREAFLSNNPCTGCEDKECKWRDAILSVRCPKAGKGNI